MEMEWLNYHHLRYFWVVAKEGSLAAAASKLHVSPSSISEQIKELEQSLGEKLFEKDGRRNRLTHAGQLVMGYSEDIFAAGREMVQVVRQKREGSRLRLHIGVVDSVPKLVTSEIFSPAYGLEDSVHMVFREGKIQDLLGLLAAHQLDMVLSDEAAGSSVNLKLFNHRLGETGTTLCAVPDLVGKKEFKWPEGLEKVPAMLPSEHTPLRRNLDAWFRSQGIAPWVAGEFDDLALMKVMAADGHGYTAIPQVAVREAMTHYGFQVLGNVTDCLNTYFIVTAQRKIVNPAIRFITETAMDNLFKPAT